MTALTTTVLVLTRPDVRDLEPVRDRLAGALRGVESDVLYVVTSPASAPERVWSTALTASRAVRSMQGHTAQDARPSQRVPDDWVVVLDAHRRHPPDLVAQMLRAGARTSADLVVVRRDASAGAGPDTGDADSGLDGRVDRLAASLVPMRFRSRGVADLQGAFAVRRDYVESFAGTGSPQRQARPVVSEAAAPGRIALAHLEAGDTGHFSKAGSMFRGPARPVLARAVASRTGRALAFAAAGATGILVNSAALWTFVEALRLPLLVAAALATQVSTTWNFVLIDRLVYPGAKGRGTVTRFLGFAVVNNVVLLLRLPLLSWLTWTAAMPYLVANVVTLVAAFLARFLISDRYLFRSRSSRHDDHAREAAVPPADGRYRRHRRAQGGVEPRALWAPRGPGGRPDLGQVDLTA